MSACGFDNHLRRQLRDRQEQQTKRTRRHLLAGKALICQADESAPHTERCCANLVHEYKKKKVKRKKIWRATLRFSVCEYLERGRNVCACVYVFDVFVQKFSDCCLQVVLVLRRFMIKIRQAACLCLAWKVKMEHQRR